MKRVWHCLNLLRDGRPEKKKIDWTRGQGKEASKTAMTTALSQMKETAYNCFPGFFGGNSTSQQTHRSP